MKLRRIYVSPVSEIVPLIPQDVITTSGIGGGWNNNGNGKPNGNTKPTKPGNGGHKG